MYHALIIKQSLKNLNPTKDLEVLTTKKDGDWLIYKVAVSEDKLGELTKKLQEHMDDSQEWYMHIYNQDGSRLIIIFRNKAFDTDNNPQNWSEVIKYGESLGIPSEQLDFVPNNFASEEY
jgi:hypothetical protein